VVRREAAGERRLAMVGKRGAPVEPPPAPEPIAASPPEPVPEPATLAQVLGRVRGLVHAIDTGELDAVRVRLGREIEHLEALQRDLAVVHALKHRLPR
jgi:hypothetical protein